MTLAKSEAILAEMVQFETVSHLSNLAFIDYVADRLDDLGAHVAIQRSPSGDKANMLARFGPEMPGGVLLSGHTDVVPVADQDWSTNPFELTARDDKLFARGACDMKGFLAACLAKAPLFAKAPLTRPLYMSFTHDEEVGCLGAQALVPWMTTREICPDIAIVGEPTGMQIIDAHKGCCEYSVHFSGLEGHGSAPDLGVNAVVYAARYAEYLMSLADRIKARGADDSPFDPPWTTVNIGGLHGGVAHNVIPGKARLDWEMRPVSWEDAEMVKDALATYCADVLLPAMQAVHPQASIETEVIGEVVGLERTENNPARELVASLTGSNTTGAVPFGTEAGLFQQMGTSVVLCGPGFIEQAHKPDEYLSRAQLTACLGMLDRLAIRMTTQTTTPSA